MDRHLTNDQRTALTLGLASAEETARWNAHLSQCETCRSALTSDREMLDALADWPTPEIDPARWNQMADDVIKWIQPSRRHADRRSFPVFFPSIPPWVWRLAVVFVAFMAGYWTGAERHGRDNLQLARAERLHSPSTPHDERLTAYRSQDLISSLTTLKLLVRVDDSHS